MLQQQELFHHCLSELESGRSVVRAVILRTWGSTPREVGADMVIDSSGGLLGTVGGGCGEAEVYELACEMLESDHLPSASILHVDLTEDPEEGGGKVCGGRFDVLLHRLSPSRDLSAVKSVVEALAREESRLWQTEWADVEPGFWKLGQIRRDFSVSSHLREGREPGFKLDIEGSRVSFTEPIGQFRKLIVVGAGHIARPLCAMASLAGYAVVVLDDRQEYAREQFFPDAFKVVCGEYQDVLPGLTRGPLVSVVLVTRGHKHDQDCLRLVAGSELEYVGMIGSQRRIDAVFAELVEEGLDADWLRGVCAPIGLDIGAQTPAEIACCILAQMIQRRRQPQAGRVAGDRVRHSRVLKG